MTKRALALLTKFRKLKVGQARDWPAWIRDDQSVIAVCVCAIKKSAEKTRKAQAELRATALRKGRNRLVRWKLWNTSLC